MKKVAQQLITQKLKQLTVKDLLFYSQKYQISISKNEAATIVNALKKNEDNPFDPVGRKRMFKKLASITSKDTAHSVYQLLMRMAKEYGVEHWLK